MVLHIFFNLTTVVHLLVNVLENCYPGQELKVKFPTSRQNSVEQSQNSLLTPYLLIIAGF